MTRRRTASFSPLYARAGTGEGCDHFMEAHVVYDRQDAGYRAQLRCRCHRHTTTSQRLHEIHKHAEAEACAWLAKRGIS